MKDSLGLHSEAEDARRSCPFAFFAQAPIVVVVVVWSLTA
jgi:hypothetical protein